MDCIENFADVDYASFCGQRRKKFFKIEIDQNILTVYNSSRQFKFCIDSLISKRVSLKPRFIRNNQNICLKKRVEESIYRFEYRNINTLNLTIIYVLSETLKSVVNCIYFHEVNYYAFYKYSLDSTLFHFCVNSTNYYKKLYILKMYTKIYIYYAGVHVQKNLISS